MSEIIDKRLLRLKQIIGDPNHNPPIPAIIPVSKSTFWNKIQKGIFPKPIYPFGAGMAFWRYEDIQKLLE